MREFDLFGGFTSCAVAIDGDDAAEDGKGVEPERGVEWPEGGTGGGGEEGGHKVRTEPAFAPQWDRWEPMAP